MSDVEETKSVKLGLSCTPTEFRALQFIQHIHGDKYDGAASVLRDYSLTQALEAMSLAQSLQPAS